MTRSSHMLLYLTSLSLLPASVHMMGCADLDDLEDDAAATSPRKGPAPKSDEDTTDPVEPESDRIDPFDPKQPPDPDPDPEPDPEPMPADKLEGIHIKQLAGLFQTVAYEMSFRPSSHAYTGPEIGDPDHGWPVHAMQWKAYETTGTGLSSSSLANAFFLTDAALSIGTTTRVVSGRAADLNALESSQSPAVFQNDPAGTWMEISIPGVSQAFAFAALAMHFWDTPVYVGANHNYPSGMGFDGSFSHSIGLQQLLFDVPVGEDLFSVCGIPANASPTIALNSVLSCNQGFVLNGGEVSLWNDYLCPGCPNGNYVPFDPNRNLNGNDLVISYYGTDSTQHLVFDPPEDATDEDITGLRVMSEALADQMMLVDEDGVLRTVEGFLADLESEDGK